MKRRRKKFFENWFTKSSSWVGRSVKPKGQNPIVFFSPKIVFTKRSLRHVLQVVGAWATPAPPSSFLSCYYYLCSSLSRFVSSVCSFSPSFKKVTFALTNTTFVPDWLEGLGMECFKQTISDAQSVTSNLGNLKVNYFCASVTDDDNVFTIHYSDESLVLLHKTLL